MPSFHVAPCIAITALAAIGGCSGPKLPTVPVTGTVTYNGAPLEGATVTFVPTGEDGARGASGVTDAQGTFKLQSLVAGAKTVPGAIPGQYAVTVAKREDVTAQLRASMGGGPSADGGKIMEEMAKNAPQPKPTMSGPPGKPGGGPAPPEMMRGRGMIGKSLVPEKYSNAVESGFTATVKESANEPFKFDLVD